MATENNEQGKVDGRVIRIAPPNAAVFAVSILAISGALLLLALFVNAVTEHKYIGRDTNSQTTITVTGDGDAYATPDIASVSFSVTNEAKTQTDARKVVDEKWKKIHDLLTKVGVEDKDIKANYSLYPKFENINQPCIFEKTTNSMGGQFAYPPCYNSGKQVLTGYEVTQSAELKVHKLDDAGKILGILADNGATNIGGLNFMVEHEDTVQAIARKAAIDKATAKANQLAKDLGVSIVRIVSFNEGGNYPMYYGGGMAVKTMSADAGAPAPAVTPGQNKYTSNVTIVYEIK